MTKQEAARNLRYKKAIVDDFNLEAITEELEKINYDCDEVRYYFEGDDETLLNSLDGNEEEEYEIKMMFSDLSAECEMLSRILYEEYVTEYFNDFMCSVSKGNNMKLVGYDSYETDYFKLTRFDAEAAQNESQKRMLRLTKSDLISTACQCFGIVTAFLNIRNLYGNLKASFDILRDEHTSFMQMIQSIEKAYEKAEEAGFNRWHEGAKEFDNILSALPDRVWVE